MEKDKEKKAVFKKLQNRAKALLEQNPSSFHEIVPSDLHELIEKLKIHQIELEMQNNELCITQARLEASQQKYFELYDLAPVGYVMMNPKGIILEINLTAADLLGLPRSQLISKYFGQFVFPDFKDVFYIHCNTVSKTREKKTCELRLVNKDGGQFYVQMNTLPILTDNGELRELRATMSDITERILLETKLLESKKTIQALNDANSESAMLLDRKGVILMINETAARRLGQPAEAMIGLSILDYLPAEVSKERMDRFNEVLSTRQPLDFQDSRKGRRYQHNLQPILDAKGDVDKVAVFGRDITLDHEAMEALVESEKKYRLLIDTAPIGIVVAQDRFLELVNPQVLTISGYSEQELTSRPFVEMVHPDDREMVKASHVRRLNGEAVPETYLMRIINKRGETKWIENKGVLITLKGRPATLNFVFDVTERHLAAEALLKSEAQKRTILDATQDLIHYIDNEMKLIWVNKAVLQEFNVSMEKITGQFCYQIFYHRNSICDGCPSVQARQTLQVESAVLHMDEKPNARYWDVFSAPLLDEKKKISGFIQIARDITAQRKAIQELQKSEATLNMLLETIPIPVFYKDREGRYLGFNKAFETFFGKSKAQLVGKSVFDISPYGLAKDYHAKDVELFERPGIQVYDSQVQDAHGVLHNVIFHKASLTDAQGSVTGLIGAILDISQRKQAEEKIHELSHLLIQSQEKERHLISCELHDSIAQNLSALKINLDLICNDHSMTPPAIREKMAASSSQLLQSIADVRNLSYDLRLPGLEDMGLVKALEIYCEEASEKGKEKVYFQSVGMSAIRLDKNLQIHIYRLIQEGLSNIRKHADADLATVLLLGSSPNVILRIEDNGRGFDVKAQEKSFAVTKRMGIRSMQERVNLLQGQMTIRSQPMKGTRIFIKIPL
jgi:PAS domain S-box-containing protein